MTKKKTKGVKPHIYLFSNKMNYKTFSAIWKKFPSTGIIPECMINGKPVWEMIRDKQIFVYLDPLNKEDPIILSHTIPKNRKVLLLENPLPQKGKRKK